MKTENFKPMQWHFSHRVEQLQSSAIREILKVTMQPEIISFAGGLPSPLAFPIPEMKAAYDKVLTEQGTTALQYGPSDGYAPLREWVAKNVSKHGATITPDQVLIVSGSQQALDLLGKVLINPGSKTLVETPSYLGALQAFSVYEPNFVSVPSDEFGIIPSALKEVGKDACLLYALPNFQNPTGRTIPLERRQELVKVCNELGIPLIEDNPYGDLGYSKPAIQSMLSMNPEGVIYMGSFSKVLTPGLRLGYVVAPKELIHKMEQAKQAADLHTSQISQMVVYEVVKDGFLDTHIPKIRQLYGDRCQVMLTALEEFFPKGVTWTHPDGGMFIWVTLPEHIDSGALLKEAVKEKVAFVPGEPFYANDAKRNNFRLSFVTVEPEVIREGVSRLGKLIAAKM